MIFFLMIINIKDFSFIAFIYFFSIQLKNDKSFFFCFRRKLSFCRRKVRVSVEVCFTDSNDNEFHDVGKSSRRKRDFFINHNLLVEALNVLLPLFYRYFI